MTVHELIVLLRVVEVKMGGDIPVYIYAEDDEAYQEVRTAHYDFMDEHVWLDYVE